MKRAVITLPGDGKTAQVITESLLPEIHRALPRTTVSLEEGEGSVSLQIRAEDTSALRAAVNSYLRWISVSWNTYRETKGNEV